MSLRVLLIGPSPPPIGGTTVLFARLREGLSESRDVSVTSVSTSGIRGRGVLAVPPFARLLMRVAHLAGSADVMTVHVSTSALHLLLPPLVFLARLNSVPLLVRKFGGTDFLDYPSWRRAVILWALRRCDMYLAETKHLVAAASATGLRDVRWYPNSRPMPRRPNSQAGSDDCRRFVFVGQIHGQKGVRELIDAAGALPDGVSVDIFGTLGFDISRSDLIGNRNVVYRGSIQPGDVTAVLSSYDVLVLPTYHAGEGYPGVILEAYAAGLPVITTTWRALPELVDDATGVLVRPRDADSLHRAMLLLVQNTALYRDLRDGVLERRSQFADELWHARFVEYCRILDDRRQNADRA
jgi:glycosyltransferase involved in cell wall biosynthesis